MFHALNCHFPDVPTFATWLATQPCGDWAVGSTYHNTFRPNEAQWRGLASMTTMAGFYAAKGWETGPHLFLASGTDHDGLFVMTPPTMPGTHAGVCNATRFGVEVVGDFHEHPMTPDQLTLLVDALAALHQWQGIGPDVLAHRDCMPGRTCPGNAAYAQKPAIIDRLAAALTRPAPTRYTPASPLILPSSTPAVSGARVKAAMERSFVPGPDGVGRMGDYTRSDVYIDMLGTYWILCDRVGLDPLILWAQLLHETGYLKSFWASRPQRNPAGIGVDGHTQNTKPADLKGWAYDSKLGLWRRGVSFLNWREHAVPAHVGRMLRYALPPETGTLTQRALMTKALSYRALPTEYWGCAPTMQGLERTWAADPNYADAIARIANSLLGER